MVQKKNTSFRIYTPELQLLAEVDYYESLRLTRKWTGIGELELHISTSDGIGEFLQKDNVIIIGGDVRKAGFIVNRQIVREENGNEKWVVTGSTLNGITNRRVTFPTVGKATHSMTNYSSEAVIISMVRRNMGIHAEANRVIPFIQTFNSQVRTGILNDKITYSTRYKKLSDECIEIATAAQLGWWFEPDLQLGKWALKFSEGEERTRGSQNPIVFTEDFENIGSFEYTEDYADYANVAIVGGEGEGEDRTIVETTPDAGVTTAINAARHEVFVDARDLQNENEDDAVNDEQLRIRGQVKLLAEFPLKESFEAEVIQTEGFIFGVNYDLGDVVTIESQRLGIAKDDRISSVTETFEGSGYVLEMVFGDENATVADKIRRFKGSIEGVKNS